MTFPILPMTRMIVTGKTDAKMSLKRRIETQTNAEIHAALRQTGGDDKRRAAELLGISRAQLYRHLSEQGVG
ncbi:transcriptional regulator with PAS, ATPase and Fis domain [Rhizobium pisi]